MPQKPIATFVQQITENVRLHLKNIYACGELDEGSTSKESLEVRPEPQGVFYDGQLWDARAFADRLVKSARKSLLLVDNFSRMPPRDSVAGGIRRFFASLGPSLLRKRGHLFPSSRQLVVSSSSSSGRGATRRGHSNPARADPKVKHELVAQMLLTVFPVLWYIPTCRARNGHNENLIYPHTSMNNIPNIRVLPTIVFFAN